MLPFRWGRKIQDLYSPDGRRLKKVPEAGSNAYFICPLGDKYAAVGILEHEYENSLEIIELRRGSGISGMIALEKKIPIKNIYVFGTLPTEDASVDYLENGGKILRIAYIPREIGNKWDEKRKREYYERVAEHLLKVIKKRNGFSPDSIRLSELSSEFYKNHPREM